MARLKRAMTGIKPDSTLRVPSCEIGLDACRPIQYVLFMFLSRADRWDFACANTIEALAGIVVQILALLRMCAGAGRMPRGVHGAIMQLVLHAEDSLKRLSLVAAHDCELRADLRRWSLQLAALKAILRRTGRGAIDLAHFQGGRRKKRKSGSAPTALRLSALSLSTLKLAGGCEALPPDDTS